MRGSKVQAAQSYDFNTTSISLFLIADLIMEQECYKKPPGRIQHLEEETNLFAGCAQLPNYAAYLQESRRIYSARQGYRVHQQMVRTTESKPRLSKEEIEILEAEFQKNHKPSSSTKKALAESMRVDNARINVLSSHP